MTVKIKEYTEADIPELIRLHRIAFSGYMNVEIGTWYIRRFFEWFLSYPDSIAMKAEFNTETCGYILGAKIGYDTQFNRNLMWPSLLGILTHPGVLLHANFIRASKSKVIRIIGMTSKKQNQTLPEGKGISLVGIASNGKINGTGTELIKGFESAARKLDYNYMRLSVYANNQRAIELYERNGWIGNYNNDSGIVYYFKQLKP